MQKNNKLPLINNNNNVSEKKSRSFWKLWKEYDDYIRSLHIAKSVKKPTRGERTKNFLFKLLFVFAGAFLTTFAFSFLLDPNGIYNSGINGLVQTSLRVAQGHNIIKNFYLWYYLIALLINVIFVLVFRIIFKAKLEVVGTAVFYVIFQIFWNYAFHFLGLRNYLFNRLVPGSWSGLTIQNQLGFTLPFYIVIAIAAAAIHTIGYGIIFRSKAVPGGLEIIASHFSSQKNTKISLGTITKIFGFLVIFGITVIDFVMIEGNSDIEQNQLCNVLYQKKVLQKEQTDMTKVLPLTQRIIEEELELQSVIDQKKEKLESARLENNNFLAIEIKDEIKNEIHKLRQIRQKEEYLVIIALKEQFNEKESELLWWDIGRYLWGKQKAIDKLTEKIAELEKEENQENFEQRNKKRQQLKTKLFNLKNNFYERTSYGYLKYVTNNERLWGTLFYVFFSAYLLSQLFPRDKLIMLKVYSPTEESRNAVLKELNKFSPKYYAVYYFKEGEEIKVHVVNCFLSKWDYHLLSPSLRELGTTYVNDESRN